MEQKVTIKDVAELAGVSKSTVSRYLNNGYISVEKQVRVRKAIEETGFQSNFFAKRLKTKPTPSAGVICGFLSGITASFFGVGGPFLAVYLIGASRSKESYTANMQFIFLITNVIIFVNKAMKGLFSLQLVPITVAGILGVLLGQWFGTKLTDRLDIDKMKMVVYVFIGISGLITIMQYIR